MGEMIEFKSEFGTIYVESHEPKKKGTQDFGSNQNATQKSKKKFEEAIDVIQGVSNAVVRKLNDTAEKLRPSELELTLGIKFSTEVGAIIAKTGAEGNIAVKIKWQFDPKSKQLDKGGE